MNDTNKAFDAWCSQSEIHGGYAYKRDFVAGWQACQQLNNKRIADLLAVIERKDNVLQKIVDDLGLTSAENALAITADVVELVEVAENDCGSIKWTNDKWPHKCKLYTIKHKGK